MGAYRFVLNCHGVDDVYSSRPGVIASLTMKQKHSTSAVNGSSTSMRPESGVAWWLQVPGHPPIATIALKQKGAQTLMDLRILHEDYVNVVDQGENSYIGIVSTSNHRGFASVSLYASSTSRPVCSVNVGPSEKLQLHYCYPLTALIALAVVACCGGPAPG